MPYEQLVTWFAPLQDQDYAMCMPMMLDEMENLTAYYYPSHLNKHFGLPKNCRESDFLNRCKLWNPNAPISDLFASSG